MVFQGKIVDGAVVLDGDTPPEGARVRVEVVDDAPAGTLADLVSKFAGKIDDLPTDMARNHDHYIHGGRKQ